MSDETEQPENADPKRSSRKIGGLPSLKASGEFLLNVLALERSVEALKAENKGLDAEVRDWKGA